MLYHLYLCSKLQFEKKCFQHFRATYQTKLIELKFVLIDYFYFGEFWNKFLSSFQFDFKNVHRIFFFCDNGTASATLGVHKVNPAGS